MYKTKAVTLALTVLCAISGFAQSRISVTDLPKPAQELLSKYFPKTKVQKVEKEWDDGMAAFEVKISGNTEVDFDGKGNWKEVSGKVPAGLIPQQIASSVKKDFGNRRIVKIERERDGGYEIELNNGTDIKYDKAFKVVHVDK